MTRHRDARILVVALALLSACTTTNGPDEQQKKSAAWSWENPRPQGHTLNDVHGSAANNILAVGDYGTILRFDGLTWRLQDSRTDMALNAVWVESPTEAWAVGDAGTVLNYNGSKWSRVMTPGGAFALYDVVVSGGVVFACGEEGVVLRRLNGNWSATFLQDPEPFDLRAFWAVAPDSIFVTGVLANTHVYDGNMWTTLPSSAGNTIFGMWGVDGRIFGVGTSRLLLELDAAGSWTELTPVATEPLHGVWGPSANDLTLVGWQTGATDAVFHYDGTGPLSNIDFGADKNFNAVWGPNAALAFMVGEHGTVFRNNGTGWMRVDGTFTSDLLTVHGFGSTLLAAGTDSRVLTRGGFGWEPSESGNAVGFSDIWLVSPDVGFAVSGLGGLFGYDTGSWTMQVSGSFRGVWGWASDEAWAVGASGVIRRFDGSFWLPATSPVATGLNAVWGRSNNDIFAAGDNGVILHYDGNQWTQLPTVVSDNLNGISGNNRTVIAVGENGSAVVVDETLGVTATTTGTLSSLAAVTVYAVADVAVAVGAGGTVLRYTTGTWEPLESPTNYDLSDAWFDGDVLYTVGENGTVLRFGR